MEYRGYVIHLSKDKYGFVVKRWLNHRYMEVVEVDTMEEAYEYIDNLLS